MSNGVLIGLMYSLIALGFVLVYKATDAINFAQGEFVMIAGFVVALAARALGAPLWLAVARRAGRHDRLRLRPGAGRCCASSSAGRSSPWSWPPSGWPPILRGVGPTFFGAGHQAAAAAHPRRALHARARSSSRPSSSLGAAVSLLFLAGFGWFFLKSRKGIAMRAVADNQQVAMAMGINVERYFGLAWAMTGIVSALGGIIWGNLLGRRREPRRWSASRCSRW